MLDEMSDADQRLSALTEVQKLNTQRRKSDVTVPELTVRHGQYPQSNRAYIYLDNSARVAKRPENRPDLNAYSTVSHLLYGETFEVGFPNSTRSAWCEE